MAIKAYRSPNDRTVLIEISPTQISSYPNGIRCSLNGTSVSMFDNTTNRNIGSYEFTDIQTQGGSPYANFQTLADTLGFKLGGGTGGSVISVTASSPLSSSGGANPDISLEAQPDGNYALNFSGGAATFVPIQGETVGSYKAFSTTTIPSNYLWCNGASVPVASYPDLFAVIGYDFGGSGLNFNLPNFTDRLPKGDNGANIGTSGGANTLTVDNLPSHSHNLVGNSSSADTGSIVNGFLSASAGSGEDLISTNLSNGETFGANSISNTGSGTPHEHPYLVVRWAICFESVGISGASSTPSFDQTLAVNNDSSIRALFNGVPYALINEPIDLADEQILTTSTPLGLSDNIKRVFVNPATTLATASIQLQNTPYNGQEVVIVAGGTITTGVVVTELTVFAAANILSGDPINPTTLVLPLNASTVLTLEYSQSLNQWFLK